MNTTEERRALKRQHEKREAIERLRRLGFQVDDLSDVTACYRVIGHGVNTWLLTLTQLRTLAEERERVVR